MICAWWGTIGLTSVAGEGFYRSDFFAEVFEGAAGEADFATEGGARHAEAFARVMGFAGKAESLPAAECEEALGDAAEEQIAAGKLSAVVTDACVEGLEACGEVAWIGGVAGVRIGLYGGAASVCGVAWRASRSAMLQPMEPASSASVK